jgi:hypothetical protein
LDKLNSDEEAEHFGLLGKYFHLFATIEFVVAAAAGIALCK